MIPSFPDIPSEQVEESCQSSASRRSNGDGYENVFHFGLNPVRPEWKILWRVGASEINEMDAFLRARAIDGEPFYWTPPDATPSAQTFKCLEWTRTRTSAIWWTFEATFERIYEPSTFDLIHNSNEYEDDTLCESDNYYGPYPTRLFRCISVASGCSGTNNWSGEHRAIRDQDGATYVLHGWGCYPLAYQVGPIVTKVSGYNYAQPQSLVWTYQYKPSDNSDFQGTGQVGQLVLDSENKLWVVCIAVAPVGYFLNLSFLQLNKSNGVLVESHSFSIAVGGDEPNWRNSWISAVLKDVSGSWYVGINARDKAVTPGVGGGATAMLLKFDSEFNRLWASRWKNRGYDGYPSDSEIGSMVFCGNDIAVATTNGGKWASELIKISKDNGAMTYNGDAYSLVQNTWYNRIAVDSNQNVYVGLYDYNIGTVVIAKYNNVNQLQWRKRFYVTGSQAPIPSGDQLILDDIVVTSDNRFFAIAHFTTNVAEADYALFEFNANGDQISVRRLRSPDAGFYAKTCRMNVSKFNKQTLLVSTLAGYQWDLRSTPEYFNVSGWSSVQVAAAVPTNFDANVQYANNSFPYSWSIQNGVTPIGLSFTREAPLYNTQVSDFTNID